MTYDLKLNSRSEDKGVCDFSVRHFLCDFLVVWLVQVCCMLSLLRLNGRSFFVVAVSP